MGIRRSLSIAGSSQWALLLFGFIGMLLLPWYRYHLNPDAIGYFSVAETYARGDFTHALNFYWAPLLSWLLVPFIKIGIDPLLSFRFVQYLLGFVFFVIFRNLCTLFPLRKEIQAFLLYTFAPLLLYFVYSWVTPDLLWLCLFFGIFLILSDPRYADRRFSGLLTGVLGALAYFARSLSFYLFPLYLLSATVLWMLYGKNRKKLSLHFIIGLLSFAVLSAPWVMALSIRHGGFTISEAGNVNRSNDGVLVAYNDLPIYSRGLLPPTHAGAVSAWDDPSTIARHDWSPFDSLSTATLQLKAVVLNVIRFFQVVVPFFWLLPALLGFYVLLALPLRQALQKRPIVHFTLLAVGLNLAAYLPFLVEVRYFWPIPVLLLLVSGHLLSDLTQHGFLTPLRRNSAFVIIFISFTMMPVWFLLPHIDDGRVFHDQSVALGQRYSLQGKRIAADHWKQGLYLSYYTGARYYGQPELGATSEKVRDELNQYAIEYYLVFGEADKKIDNYHVINTINGVTLYQRTSTTNTPGD